MEPSARIAAVIINYKTPALCLEAVRSLYSELDSAQDQIVVVDNCSDDGSIDALRLAIATKPWSGRIEILESEYNGGFSYGNNFAMSKVNAKAYLLLNSDATVKPGAVLAMWEALQADAKRALVGPLVLGDDEASQVSCFVDRSPWNEFLATAKTGLFTKLFGCFGVQEVALPPGSPEREVDWLSFVCVLVRGTAYQDVGPMDEGYFMYKEDNDYCRRARAKGWQVYYLPKAGVIHLNKGWSAKQWARQPAFFYESRTRYFRKYYGFSGFIWANGLWTLGRLIHLSREIVQHKPPSVAAYAWRDIWTLRSGTKPIKLDE